MSDLNRRQRSAIHYLDGPLLVLAGAGSGKTRVITHKIAHLVQRKGYAPETVAAVTFTNKAAREMKHRVAELTRGGRIKGLRISTFHNLGLHILREHAPGVGLKPGFTIFNAQDTQTLMAEVGGRGRNLSEPADMAAHIARWMAACLQPQQVVISGDAERAEARAAEIFGRYDAALRSYNAVDFEDLIVLPLQLLQTHTDIRRYWRSRIRYLLVDEYQDTNLSQYLLVRALVGRRAAFTVVGDDDQSIYAWRGAHPENLAKLASDFPRLKVIKLEQNYRSSANILAAANGLIANNAHVFEKKLTSHRGYGVPLRLLEMRDGDAEADLVVTDLFHHRLNAGGRFGDYAILYRGNHQSRAFERALRERNIPYSVSGSRSFFDYAEIRDVMAYLKLLVNQNDDNAFLRVVNTPRRSIGAGSLSALSNCAEACGLSLFNSVFESDLENYTGRRAAAHLLDFGRWLGGFIERNNTDTPLELIDELLDQCAYRAWLEESAEDPMAAQRRLANLDELLTWLRSMYYANDGKLDLTDLLARLCLADLNEDDDEIDHGSVKLLTLHAAKGLEFRHVYLTGMEEGLLPHHSSTEEAAVAEERRLAYVGVTRAQDTLTLTRALARRRYGKIETTLPSRFLDELPSELVGKPVQRSGADRSEGRNTIANLKRLLQDY